MPSKGSIYQTFIQADAGQSSASFGALVGEKYPSLPISRGLFSPTALGARQSNKNTDGYSWGTGDDGDFQALNR